MSSANLTSLKANISRRKLWNSFFALIGLITILSSLIILLALVIQLVAEGYPRISGQFFLSYPSRFPEQSGILSAWVGSFLVMFVTACTAVPLGIASGIYLEEYARKNILADIIEVNVTNLAGVPSIVYGLLALGLFVYKLQLGKSVLTAGLTLALLILPIVIVTTREALRAIPTPIREAAYAMGASKWQMVWDHVLPYSFGSILTGIIIGLSRAIGETAPVITIGALTYIAFLPTPPLTGELPIIPLQQEVVITIPSQQTAVNGIVQAVRDDKTEPLEFLGLQIQSNPQYKVEKPEDLGNDTSIGGIYLEDQLEFEDFGADSFPEPPPPVAVEGDLPIVRIQVIDDTAIENDPANVARFILFREGEIAEALPVSLRVAGDISVQDYQILVSDQPLSGNIRPNLRRLFEWLQAPFTVMPIQMFNWVSLPDKEFQVNASAAGTVLITMTLLMNGIAIYLRYRFRKGIQW